MGRQSELLFTTQFTPPPPQLKLVELVCQENTVICLSTTHEKDYVTNQLIRVYSSNEGIRAGKVQRAFALILSGKADRRTQIKETLICHTNLKVISVGKGAHDSGAHSNSGTPSGNGRKVGKTSAAAGRCDVIIVTPQIAEEMISQGLLNPALIKLVIVDECLSTFTDPQPSALKLFVSAQSAVPTRVVALTMAMDYHWLERTADVKGEFERLGKAFNGRVEPVRTLQSSPARVHTAQVERHPWTKWCNWEEDTGLATLNIDPVKVHRLTKMAAARLQETMAFISRVTLERDGEEGPITDQTSCTFEWLTDRVTRNTVLELCFKVLLDVYQTMNELGLVLMGRLAAGLRNSLKSHNNVATTAIEKKVLLMTKTELRLLEKLVDQLAEEVYGLDDWLAIVPGRVCALVEALGEHEPKLSFNISEARPVAQHNDGDDAMSLGGESSLYSDFLSDDESFDGMDLDPEPPSSMSNHGNGPVTMAGGYSRSKGYSAPRPFKSFCGVVYASRPSVAFALHKFVEDIIIHATGLYFIRSVCLTESSQDGRAEEMLVARFKAKDKNLLFTTVDQPFTIPNPVSMVIMAQPVPDLDTFAKTKAQADSFGAVYRLLYSSEEAAQYEARLESYHSIEQLLIEKCLSRSTFDELDLEAHLSKNAHLLPVGFSPYWNYKPERAAGKPDSGSADDDPKEGSTNGSGGGGRPVDHSSHVVLSHEGLPWDEEESEEERNDSSLSLVQAIYLVNKYCRKLPSDMFTRLHPSWHVEQVEMGNSAQAYVCHLQMPVNSPLKDVFKSDCMPTSQLAQMDAALKACQRLYAIGELHPYTLEPIGKQIPDMRYPEMEVDFKREDAARAPPGGDEMKGSQQPIGRPAIGGYRGRGRGGGASQPPKKRCNPGRPGSVKRKQLYERKLPDILHSRAPFTPLSANQAEASIPEHPAQPMGPPNSVDQPTQAVKQSAEQSAAADAAVQSPPLLLENGVPGYLYSVAMKLTCPITEDGLVNAYPVFVTENHPRKLGFISPVLLPPIPSFPIYTRSGEEHVTIRPVYGSRPLSSDDIIKTCDRTSAQSCDATDESGSPTVEKQLSLLREGHLFFFSEIIPVSKTRLAYDWSGSTGLGGSSGSGPPFLCTALTETGEIDWPFLTMLVAGKEKWHAERTKRKESKVEVETEPFVFQTDDFSDAVLVPSYRGFDHRELFYVAQIRTDWTPLEPFPSATYTTFAHYYKEKYGITLTNLTQPLLSVERTPKRLNMQTPRYYSHRGDALPIAAGGTAFGRAAVKSAHAGKKDRDRQSQMMVAELCCKHPVPASFWRKAVCFPSIIQRMVTLLSAEQLRSSIAVGCGLGPVIPPLDTGCLKPPYEVRSLPPTSNHLLAAVSGSDPGAMSSLPTSREGRKASSHNSPAGKTASAVETSGGDSFMGQPDASLDATAAGLKLRETGAIFMNPFAESTAAGNEETTANAGAAGDCRSLSRTPPRKRAKASVCGSSEPSSESLMACVTDPSENSVEKMRCTNEEDSNDEDDDDDDGGGGGGENDSEVGLWGTLSNCDNNETGVDPVCEDDPMGLESALTGLQFHDPTGPERGSSQGFRTNHLTRASMLITGRHSETDNGEVSSSSPYAGLALLYDEGCKPYSDPQCDGQMVKAVEGGVGPGSCHILECVTLSSANDFLSLERLETIGDSFLKFYVSDHLYAMFPGAHEGRLSYGRGRLVSNFNLYRLGRKKEVEQYIIGNKFEPADNWVPPSFTSRLSSVYTASKSVQPICNMHTQLCISDKCVADVVEALIGCFLLDSGLGGAQVFMKWLGIDVLTKTEIKGNTTESARPMESCSSDGSQPPLSHSVWPLPSSVDNLSPSIPNTLNVCDSRLRGYEKFEKILGYRFKDRALLVEAFTHASYHDKAITGCYQRLEFLGDAVLDYVITRQLYADVRRHTPGALTDLRSSLVNNLVFAALAVKWGFHKHILCSSPKIFSLVGAYVTYQKKRKDVIVVDEFLRDQTIQDCDEEEEIEVPKILGDVFESVAGAIYLDSGKQLKVVWGVYYRLMKPQLQEYYARVPKSPVRLLHETFPEAVKFSRPERIAGEKVRVTVTVMGLGDFSGIGRSCKMAKTSAAKRALASTAAKIGDRK